MAHIHKNLYSFPSIKDLSKGLNDLIAEAANEAHLAGRKFTIALSGGSLATQLASALPKHDPTTWNFFFADERCVLLDSPDSNYLGFVKPVFEPLGVKPEQIHTINPALITDPDAAAKDYQGKLAKVFGAGVPVFDVILLGMGTNIITQVLMGIHAVSFQNIDYAMKVLNTWHLSPTPQNHHQNESR
jgi:6-phosphogluconolactonase